MATKEDRIDSLDQLMDKDINIVGLKNSYDSILIEKVNYFK